jgi:hypothetical protein
VFVVINISEQQTADVCRAENIDVCSSETSYSDLAELSVLFLLLRHNKVIEPSLVRT